MADRIDMTRLQPPGVTERFLTRMIADLRGYWDNDGGLDRTKVEVVDCSLCQTACPCDVYFVRERFPYRKCPTCGLVYPSPRPRQQYLKEQYLSGRFAEAIKDLHIASAAYRMETIFKERVEEIMASRVHRGRILDVGCGTGHFLAVAAAHGYEVYGVEPNPAEVQFAKSELKLPNIHCGTLSDANYPASTFDAVTIWDVLEHVEQPGVVLKEIARVLKPGGWVFAYTENFESFNVFVTREYSEIVTPEVHLRHYSPDTFRREFEQVGFRVEEVFTRGLDLAHIGKTMKFYTNIFQNEPMPLLPEQEAAFQDYINQVGKGDNLRLYARKM